MDKSGAYPGANAPPVEPYSQPPPSYNQSQNVYPSGQMSQPMYGQPTPMSMPMPTPMQPMGMQQPTILTQTVQGNPGIYQQHQQPIIVQVAGNQIRVGPTSCPVNCPACHKFINTRVEHAVTAKTHLIAFILCLMGCIPCAVIPYCMDACQDAHHYCPECHSFIGVYNTNSYHRY